MSLFGNLFHLSIKKIICGCSLNTKDDALESITETAEMNDVLVLPCRANDILTNLFPISNHVRERFNILCVGSDKNYIMVKIADLQLAGCEQLENNSYSKTMPASFRNLLDEIWTKALSGKVLQFYLVYRSRTFICNAFPLTTDEKTTVGAICFIRGVQYETKSGEYKLSVDGEHRKGVGHIPKGKLIVILSNESIIKTLAESIS